MANNPQSPEARIQFLRHQRRAIDAELRHLLGTALPRPRYHCLRCGQDWQGLYANRPPAHCTRCHSRGWRTEPKVPRAKREYPKPTHAALPVPVRIDRKPWEGNGMPPPPQATLPPPIALSQEFRRRMEEPQPEARISGPMTPTEPEIVVEITPDGDVVDVEPQPVQEVPSDG